MRGFSHSTFGQAGPRIVALVLSSFLQILRIFLGLTLILAGVGKLVDPSNAIGTLEKLFSLPGVGTVLITMLSFIELSTGTGILLSERNLRHFALGAVILMFGFLVLRAYYAEQAMRDCGCYGAFGRVSESSALQDAILLVCAVAVLLFPKSSLAIHKLPLRFATVFPIVTAIF